MTVPDRDPNRVLVTGATGFVGAAVVRQLLARGAAVRILRRATSALDLLGAAGARVEHAVGDLADPEAVGEAVAECGAVVHCAAAVAFGPGAADTLHRVNVVGTATVVDACLRAGVRRLVHVSSIAALGRTAGGSAAPIDETAVWTDSPANTAYAVSKHRAEREVQRGVAKGLDAVIVNPAVVFGPGRPGENTMAVAERAMRGMPVAPSGGTAVVDVEDVAAGVLAALDRGETGRRYVLAGENLSWREILGTLARAAGAAPPTRTVPPALLTLAGVVAELASRLGLPTALTRETARTASRTDRYAAGRAERELGVSFRPFAETAARIAAARIAASSAAR